MNPDVKLEKLKEMLSLLDEGLTREEFVKSFSEVLKVVKEVKDTSSTEWKALKEGIDRIKADLSQTHSQSVDDIKGQVDQVFVGEKVAEMRKLIEEKIASVRDGIDGKDGKDGAKGEKGDKGDPGETGLQGIDGSPDTGIRIRDKLEKLLGDERLDVSAIKGLEKELDKIKQTFSRGQTVVAIQRGQVTAYDLSASLNGVLKTFSLPTFWKVISVHLSSVPNILRPTVDYTTDAGAMTITFTSEIDAASSLNTGQTLLVVYAEN